MYGYGNPVNYTDPSGNIAETEAGRAVEIVRELRIYNVYVKVDWGMDYFLRNVINQPGVRNCVWMEGEWELKELESVRKGVVDLARVMGLNSFIYNLGYVNVQKGTMDKDYVATGGLHSLTVNNIRHDVDLWTTVHELGHAWDQNFNSELSKGLVTVTTQYEPHERSAIDCSKDKINGLPGCNKVGYFYGGIPAAGSNNGFNPVEDFAESVAAYVYPGEAHTRVEKFIGRGDYEKFLVYPDYRMTLRWRYINALIYSTNRNRPR